MSEAQEPNEVGAPTSATAWKESKEREEGAKPVKVPSGNVALVKRRDLMVYLRAGRIPNALLPLVRASIQQNSGMDKKEVDLSIQEAVQDENVVQDMITLCDMITVECVVEPKVHPAVVCEFKDGDGVVCGKAQPDHVMMTHKYEGEDRDADLLYVDDVDFDDKMAIFNYVIGGDEALKSFRKQSEGDVESVSDREAMGDQAERVDAT